MKRSLDEKYLPLKILNFIQLLINSIKNYDDQNLIKSCLNCIAALIIFSQNIYTSIDGNFYNAIHNEFMKYSIITRLEQLALHNNPEISNKSRHCQCQISVN